MLLFLPSNILNHKYAEQTTQNYQELWNFRMCARSNTGVIYFLTNLNFKSSLVISDGRNSVCA